MERRWERAHYLADLLQQLVVSKRRVVPRLVPLPVECDLVPITAFNDPVQSIVAYVRRRAFKPLQPSTYQTGVTTRTRSDQEDVQQFIEPTDLDLHGALANVEVLLHDGAVAPALFPVELLRDLGPEAAGVLDGAAVQCTVLLRGRHQRLARELRAGEDQVVLLRSEGLAKDDGVQVGDPAGPGGKMGHGLHVAEVTRRHQVPLTEPGGGAAGRRRRQIHRCTASPAAAAE